MTRKRFRYLAGTYVAVLLLLLAGASLTRDDRDDGAIAAADTAIAPEDEDIQIVEVIEKEWELIPNNLVLKPGRIRFVLINEGTKTHDFQVSRDDFDKKSKRVGVGRSRNFELTLEAGEYVFFCPISGHRGKGMEGHLTVEG